MKSLRVLVRQLEAALATISDDAEACCQTLNVKKPYLEPLLREKANYADFLKELHSRGLLRWRRAKAGEKGLLGILF